MKKAQINEPFPLDFRETVMQAIRRSDQIWNGFYRRSILKARPPYFQGHFSGSDPTPVNLNPYRLDRLYEDDRPQDRLVEEKLQAGTCKVPLLSQG